jgi:hypothetical protein
MMPEQMVEMMTNLGGTMTSLVACFWYIKYLTDSHKDREIMWMNKDTESDKALRELQSSTHSQLLSILTSVNTSFKDMTVAIEQNSAAIEQLRIHLGDKK